MWRQALRSTSRGVQTLARSARGISTTPQAWREKYINNLQLLGRAGADPRQIGSENKPFVILPMATNHFYRTREEDGSYTEGEKAVWHQLNVYRPWLQQLVVSNVRKGTRMLVNGRLDYNTVTREDGSTVKMSHVVVSDLVVIGNPYVPKESDSELAELDEQQEPIS